MTEAPFERDSDQRIVLNSAGDIGVLQKEETDKIWRANQRLVQTIYDPLLWQYTVD